MATYYFQPKAITTKQGGPGPAYFAPDGRANAPYVFDEGEDIVFAVNMALATGRPLLLLGPSGSGKSSLAAAVAAELGWTYLEHVITAGTEWRDLCWRYDGLARLADAQAGNQEIAREAAHYVVPGVLWTGFNPASARGQLLRWRKGAASAATELPDPNPKGVAILIDEIDKAEPSVPNDLLIPLGSRRFMVEETGETVQMPRKTPDKERLPFGPLLVIITSNGERQMPDAFSRRCVTHVVAHPDEAQLLKIAQAHFGSGLSESQAAIARTLAGMLMTSRAEMRRARRRESGTAEYLDALHAAFAMSTDTATDIVQRLAAAMFEKPTEDQAHL